MAIVTKLNMQFLTASDKSVTMSIEDPQAGLDKATIKTAMDNIVTLNIFAYQGAELVKSKGAKIVTTDTTGYDLV